MRCTGLKKWIPTTRSGRRLASAMRAMGSAEVLEAKIRLSGATSSSSRRT
jgi:hypothetical protein